MEPKKEEHKDCCSSSCGSGGGCCWGKLAFTLVVFLFGAIFGYFCGRRCAGGIGYCPVMRTCPLTGSSTVAPQSK